MMKLRWDPIAKENITNIYEIYKQHCGPKTAKKIINNIYLSTKMLKEQPYLGFLEPSLSDSPAGYRSLIEGHYKIVYCIEVDDYIRIVTIFDCRQTLKS